MNEYKILWTGAASLIGLVIASTLYAIGGRKYKAIRRFGGSLILTVTIVMSAIVMEVYSHMLWIIYPLLAAGFSLGYGGDGFWEKLTRRSIYAIAICGSGLFLALLFGVPNGFNLFYIHLVMGAISVALGLANPVYAPIEEMLVCMVLNIMLIAYPYLTGIQ